MWQKVRHEENMSENHFRVIYEGPSVEDGEMEIGQLAPSLLALGKLVEALDVIATGETGRVRVLVRADPKPGSFDIGLAGLHPFGQNVAVEFRRSGREQPLDAARTEWRRARRRPAASSSMG
jgi:hypothetical protein